MLGLADTHIAEGRGAAALRGPDAEADARRDRDAPARAHLSAPPRRPRPGPTATSGGRCAGSKRGDVIGPQYDCASCRFESSSLIAGRRALFFVLPGHARLPHRLAVVRRGRLSPGLLHRDHGAQPCSAAGAFVVALAWLDAQRAAGARARSRRRRWRSRRAKASRWRCRRATSAAARACSSRPIAAFLSRPSRRASG